MALLPSLLFCLRNLPLSQAIKIPIIIYNSHIYKNTGRVIIDSPNVSFGMIRLGLFITNQYPNSGISLYNKGTIVFKGQACIGANSSITVLRKDAYLEFGNLFGNVTSVRINCDYRIVFKDKVRVGWDVFIMDSSMHRLKDLNNNFIDSGYGEVFIGENTWIASQCMIVKGVHLPSYTVVGARSLVNESTNGIPDHSLIAGTPARLKKQGVWRDLDDDKIIIEN